MLVVLPQVPLPWNLLPIMYLLLLLLYFCYW